MNWKRFLSALLAAMMLLSCCAFAEENAEEAEEVNTTLEIALNGRIVGEEPTHITVCNSTKVNGAFFTSQFGTNTSDIDVRYMLHGYNPIVWDTQLSFITDPTVVADMTTAEVNGDRVYTFTLWDDLTWNDGTPMTAADYVFAYLLQISDEFQAISGDTDVWAHILGSEAYSAGETEYLAGVHLLDDYRFSVTVKGEYLPFFYELSYLFILPCPASVIAPGCEVAEDKNNGAYIRNIDETIEEPLFTADLLRATILNASNGYLSHPMLTCGPYKLVSYDAASGTVEFTLNEYYKGNYVGVKPVINDVTLIPALPQDMPEMLANGEVDLINKAVDGDTINDCMTMMPEGGLSFENYARLGYGFIGLTCEQGPQQFQKVRQAIAYAFDTDDFIQDLLQGYGLAVYGYYGLGQWMTQAAMGSLRPEDMTAEQEVIWDSFTLDNLNTYAYNPDQSLQLLIEDGWVLNKKGEAFDPEKDTVRYKRISDDELMALSFDFGLTIDNLAAADVLQRLQTTLVPLGVEIVVHEVTFNDLLIDYLREEGKREYDMSFLAHNFVSVFDPLVELYSGEDVPGSQNATGIYDQEMIDLCWEMHHTEPGDVQTYEERWLAFQQRFNEILPSVPLYSDIYFDFFSDWLQNYHPGAEANWPNAIIYAFWAEPVEEELPAEEEFFEGDEAEIPEDEEALD